MSKFARRSAFHAASSCVLSGRLGAPLLVLTRCTIFALLFALPAGAAEAESPRPSFVVFMAEAQGWSSLSSPIDDQVPNSKSDVNLTVNLDRLAKQGMRFSCAYAASPRCTPSRASFFTGKSPAQLHMTFVHLGRGENGGASNPLRRLLEPACLFELPETETTIADLLKRQGYATAHLGKWHVGRVRPQDHGFDESDGPTGNEGLTNNPTEPGRMAERGIDFMARQVKAGKPFYLQLSYYPARGSADVVAATFQAVKQRLGGKLSGRAGQAERRAVEAASAGDMDDSIGRVLDKIDELGISGNTYVIYTADHGSQGRNSNAPLSFGKGTIWEGGLRVPLIVRGPAIAPGSDSHVRSIAADLFPTIAELAHSKAPLPKGVEGGSLVAVLTHGGAGAVKRPREELVFHFPHYDMDEYGPASAIILGNYKLIRFYASASRQLFDLQADISEQHDLSKEMPAKAREMDDRLSAYLKDIGAQLPTPNPGFDPSKGEELLRPKEGRQ